MSTTTTNMSEVARWLGISRQAVAKLNRNRERTGMPLPPWDEASVKEWHRNFVPHRGPRKKVAS